MRRYLSGGTLIVIAALIIAVPFLAPPCAMETGKPIMKCVWACRAAACCASAMLSAGVAVLLLRSSAAKAALSFVYTHLSVLVVLIPTTVIGMCGKPLMPCRTLTEPLFILGGALGAIVAAIMFCAFFIAANREKK